MKPAHLEIGAADEDEARDFFTTLFGWRFMPMDRGGWFDTGPIKTGLHGGDPEPGIVVYFDVPDIEQAVETVRFLGGISDDPTPHEPGFGRFATCRGPQGIRFGLRQA